MAKYHPRQSTVLKKYKVRIPKLFYMIYGLVALETIFMILSLVFEDALTFTIDTSGGYFFETNFSWSEVFSRQYLPNGFLFALVIAHLAGAIIITIGSYLYVRSQFFDPKDVTEDNVVINDEKGKLGGYLLYFAGLFALAFGEAVLRNLDHYITGYIPAHMMYYGTLSMGRGGKLASVFGTSIIITAVTPYAILMVGAIDLRWFKRPEREVAKQYKRMNF